LSWSVGSFGVSLGAGAGPVLIISGLELSVKSLSCSLVLLLVLLLEVATLPFLSDFLNQKEGIKKQIIRDKQKNEKRIIKNFKNYQQINQKILKLVKNS